MTDDNSGREGLNFPLKYRLLAKAELNELTQAGFFVVNTACSASIAVFLEHFLTQTGTDWTISRIFIWVFFAHAILYLVALTRSRLPKSRIIILHYCMINGISGDSVA